MEPKEVQKLKVIFDGSYKRFLGSLPRVDAQRFETCSSPDGVREALIDMRGKVKTSQDKTLTRWLGVFDRLNRKLQQYFDTLNVAVGTNDCAAMVYSSIRLVILLAGALPSFLDKFVAMMSLMIDSFPQYVSISSIFSGQCPERLQLHLGRVFDDFFECLRISARVFISSSGKIKRPAELIATAIWRPFDAQFGNLMDRMRAHQQYISLELDIFQTAQMSKQADYTHKDQQLREAQQSMLEELRKLYEADRHAHLKDNHETAASRILQWLNPSTFAQSFEDSRETRREGTSQWFLDYDEFKTWGMTGISASATTNPGAFPSSVLWISGNPGCGKTILASGIIDFLSQSDISACDAGQVVYFFFSHLHEHARTIEAAYRAILAQLLEKNRDNESFLDKFLFVRYKKSSTSGQQVATKGDLLNLLKIISSEIGTVHVVLDGIDETDNADEVSRRLKELANTASVKILCLSRPNIDFLLRQISPSCRINFDRQTSNADIQLVATGIVEEMMLEGLLPDAVVVLDLIKALVLGADGMFLWIRLMSVFLKSPALTPSRRARIIQDVGRPEGLDVMYDRFAALIANSPAHERELASRIFTWVQFAKEECTEDVLLKGVFEDGDDFKTPSDLPWMALATCGGLVEYTHRKTFKFIHLTVREYLTNEPWLRLGIQMPLVPSYPVATATIIRRCLRHLSSQAPKLRPPRSFEKPTDEDKVTFNGSFESYVARYWECHLATLGPSLLIQLHDDPMGYQLYQSLHEFVSNPFAVGYWLQCLYRGLQNYDFTMPELGSWLHAVTSSLSPHSFGLNDFEVLQQSVQQLGDMRDEVHSINEKWGDRLFEMPALLWDDVLMFQKHGILAKIPHANSGQRVTLEHVLEPKLSPGHLDCELRLLGSVSRIASNGRFLGVLSVYCPTSMEHFWDMMEDTPDSYARIEQFSTGWTAVYQTWTTSSHTCLSTMSLCIPPTQIILLLRQSFRRVLGPDDLGHIDRYLGSNKIKNFSVGSDRDKNESPPELLRSSSPSTAPTSQRIADTLPADRDDNSYKRFKLSFPMSMAHDCQSFSILRGVYWVRCDESGKFSEHDIESCDLPLQSLPHYQSRWTEDLQPLRSLFGRSQFGSSLEWVVAQDTYTYSVTFDADGTTILFADYQRPCSSHLLIFKVDVGPDTRIGFFRSIKLAAPMGLLTQPLFNNSRLLLAFILEGKVWTWEYQDENASPEKSDMMGKELVSVKSIAFSDCNDYILMNNHSGSTRVLRVIDCLRQESRCDHHTGLLSVAANPPTALQKDQAVDMGSLVANSLRSGQVFTDMTLVSAGSGQSQPLVLGISTAQNSVRLGLLGESGSFSTCPSLQLLSLPKTFNLDNTTVSLLPPLRHGQSPQIMFNKAPSGEYIVSKRKREQHPSILSRDLTSVFRVSETPNKTAQLEQQPIERQKLEGENVRKHTS